MKGFVYYKKKLEIAVKNIRNNIFTDYSKYYVLDKSKLTYAENSLFTFHNADFLKDPLFIESYKLGKDTDKDKVLLKDNDIRWRIHVLLWAASHASKLDGDFVDCGVNTGIFSRSIINYTGFNELGKKYYLLDTFNGLANEYSSEEEINEAKDKPYYIQDNLFERVKETFRPFNVRIIKGAIPETLTQVKTNKVSFLSIDMNCVLPEIEALEYFWPKMVRGGMIILDDYGYRNKNQRQKAAHDAFAKSKGVEILTLPTCQGMIVKP